MIKRRRADVALGGLSPQVVAILLGGWEARAPGHPEDDDDDGVWELLCMDERGIALLWLKHEHYLFAEAKRLRVKAAWPCEWLRSKRPLLFGAYILRRVARLARAEDPAEDGA